MFKFSQMGCECSITVHGVVYLQANVNSKNNTETEPFECDMKRTI